MYTIYRAHSYFTTTISCISSDSISLNGNNNSLLIQSTPQTGLLQMAKIDLHISIYQFQSILVVKDDSTIEFNLITIEVVIFNNISDIKREHPPPPSPLFFLNSDIFSSENEYFLYKRMIVIRQTKNRLKRDRQRQNPIHFF